MGGTMRYIRIEMKRSLMERRFQIIVLFLVIISIFMSFPIFLPEKINYINSNISDIKLTFNDIDVWKRSLGTRMMTAFLPLFPALIYGHSLVDDIETGYADHIMKKIGYKKYYISKLVSSMILGGGCLFLTSILSYFLLRIIYFTGVDMDKLDSVLNLKYEFQGFSNMVFSNKFLYVLFISSILFILGAIYAAVGYLISLYTKNKMLIYTVPVLSLRIYEDFVYLISLIISKVTGNDESSFYSAYSIFSGLGDYSSGRFLFNSLLFSLVIFGIIRYKLAKQMKCEGDNYEFKAINDK